jgi:hypothetical protein
MAFVEDPTDFLDDFGVTVTAGGISGLGILDMPGEYIGPNGQVITTEYVLRAEVSKFGALGYDSSITVDGSSYTVREAPLLIDDGIFCLLLLTKAAAAANNITTLSGVNITTLSGVPLVTL